MSHCKNIRYSTRAAHRFLRLFRLTCHLNRSATLFNASSLGRTVKKTQTPNRIHKECLLHVLQNVLVFHARLYLLCNRIAVVFTVALLRDYLGVRFVWSPVFGYNRQTDIDVITQRVFERVIPISPTRMIQQLIAAQISRIAKQVVYEFHASRHRLYTLNILQ